MKLSAVTPKLLLTPDVHERLAHWTDIAAGEFSCLGLADETGGCFRISEVFLIKQTCSSAETELDSGAVATLLAELDAAGVDIARVRAWIHSHGSLNVFWSSTDVHTIETLLTGEWIASLVVNKAGASLGRIDIARPVRATLDEIPIDVAHPELGLRAACEREFRDNVTEVVAPLMARGDGRCAAERRLVDEGRLSRTAPLGLDWDDLDDLLGPELGDRRRDVGP